MILYRLTKFAYRNDLSGAGAEKFGGRWNSPGTALIYTSSSRALCALEIAVHTPLNLLPANYHMVSLLIPDDISLKRIENGELPPHWNSYPHVPDTLKIGDEFCRSLKFAVLVVPSAIVKGDYNYLLNPNHPDAKRIRVTATEEFEFDKRLFVK